MVRVARQSNESLHVGDEVKVTARWGWICGVAVAAAIALLMWRFHFEFIAAGLLAVNLVTLLTYGFDKLRARGGRGERVPERTLHALALAGGSPAAWIAQRLFRHKTIKPEFQRVFRAIVITQALAIGIYLAWRAGLLGR